MDTGPFTGRNLRLFRGSCGLKPRRRRQPGSGATCSEPVFPTKREGAARRCRRHAMAAEALVPPDAACSRRDSCRDSRRNSVHKCPKMAPRGPILPFVYTIAIPRPPTTQAHGTTVYTNAPKRPRGAISTDLCTLLRPRICPQQRNSPTVYTNAPIWRGEARSSHLCTLLRSQGHPQPKPTAQQCTQMPQNGTERSF